MNFKNQISSIVSVVLLLGISNAVMALTGVNPNGVNVSTHGPTTVFVTFQGTIGQTSDSAFWCGELQAGRFGNTVYATDPCQPGTLFGFLPDSLDLSSDSGTGGAVNMTDIMTIPSSVSRRAFQAAKRGDNSSFFYVRRFTDTVTGLNQFIAVTCRMSGGGARVPLALMNVSLVFNVDGKDSPITLLTEGQQSPPIGAHIYYNGTGRLTGRWEIMEPGDQEPTAFDLLPEASLPIEQRDLQKKYTVLDRFDTFLPPIGKVFIPGPAADKIPTDIIGPYKLLFRVEATHDTEGDSNTGTEVVESGGVSGFPMPVLRYYVASDSDVAAALANVEKAELSLMLPLDNGTLSQDIPVEFSWVDVDVAAIYLVELFSESENILSAIVKPGVSVYATPPWIREEYAGIPLKWRVQALRSNGSVQAESNWRVVTLN